MIFSLQPLDCETKDPDPATRTPTIEMVSVATNEIIKVPDVVCWPFTVYEWLLCAIDPVNRIPFLYIAVWHVVTLLEVVA